MAINNFSEAFYKLNPIKSGMRKRFSEKIKEFENDMETIKKKGSKGVKNTKGNREKVTKLYEEMKILGEDQEIDNSTKGIRFRELNQTVCDLPDHFENIVKNIKKTRKDFTLSLRSVKKEQNDHYAIIVDSELRGRRYKVYYIPHATEDRNFRIRGGDKSSTLMGEKKYLTDQSITIAGAIAMDLYGDDLFSARSLYRLKIQPKEDDAGSGGKGD